MTGRPGRYGETDRGLPRVKLWSWNAGTVYGVIALLLLAHYVWTTR